MSDSNSSSVQGPMLILLMMPVAVGLLIGVYLLFQHNFGYGIPLVAVSLVSGVINFFVLRFLGAASAHSDDGNVNEESDDDHV